MAVGTATTDTSTTTSTTSLNTATNPAGGTNDIATATSISIMQQQRQQLEKHRARPHSGMSPPSSGDVVEGIRPPSGSSLSRLGGANSSVRERDGVATLIGNGDNTGSLTLAASPSETPSSLASLEALEMAIATTPTTTAMAAAIAEATMAPLAPLKPASLVGVSLDATLADLAEATTLNGDHGGGGEGAGDVVNDAAPAWNGGKEAGLQGNGSVCQGSPCSSNGASLSPGNGHNGQPLSLSLNLNLNMNNLNDIILAGDPCSPAPGTPGTPGVPGTPGTPAAEARAPGNPLGAAASPEPTASALPMVDAGTMPSGLRLSFDPAGAAELLRQVSGGMPDETSPLAEEGSPQGVGSAAEALTAALDAVVPSLPVQSFDTGTDLALSASSAGEPVTPPALVASASDVAAATLDLSSSTGGGAAPPSAAALIVGSPTAPTESTSPRVLLRSVLRRQAALEDRLCLAQHALVAFELGNAVPPLRDSSAPTPPTPSSQGIPAGATQLAAASANRVCRAVGLPPLFKPRQPAPEGGAAVAATAAASAAAAATAVLSTNPGSKRQRTRSPAGSEAAAGTRPHILRLCRNADPDATDTSSSNASDSEGETDTLSMASQRASKQTQHNFKRCLRKRRRVQAQWDQDRGELGWRWNWLRLRCHTLLQEKQVLETHVASRLASKPSLACADADAGCARAKGLHLSKPREVVRLQRQHLTASFQRRQPRARSKAAGVGAAALRAGHAATVRARAAALSSHFHPVLSLLSDAPAWLKPAPKKRGSGGSGAGNGGSNATPSKSDRDARKAARARPGSPLHPPQSTLAAGHKSEKRPAMAHKQRRPSAQRPAPLTLSPHVGRARSGSAGDAPLTPSTPPPSASRGRMHDIDNIVIPAAFATTRVEAVEVKEIVTPSFRQRTLTPGAASNGDGCALEDVSDEAYAARHAACLVLEQSRMFSGPQRHRKRLNSSNSDAAFRNEQQQQQQQQDAVAATAGATGITGAAALATTESTTAAASPTAEFVGACGGGDALGGASDASGSVLGVCAERLAAARAQLPVLAPIPDPWPHTRFPLSAEELRERQQEHALWRAEQQPRAYTIVRNAAAEASPPARKTETLQPLKPGTSEPDEHAKDTSKGEASAVKSHRPLKLVLKLQPSS